jgi:hypothetical protein
MAEVLKDNGRHALPELVGNKSNRIVLFADLRDSTEILINFDCGDYKAPEGSTPPEYTYEQFIRDVHKMAYQELYLNHEYTYAAVYGDGVMGIFPEDNTKYILENIYRLMGKLRRYNDTIQRNNERPHIDMGFAITLGEVSFVYYPFDNLDHPVGQCIHEVARIESLSKFYDARFLISHRFFNFAKGYLESDPRFSHRFIDQVVLRGFREPVTLFEILLDNDPRFKIKKDSIPAYAEAYAKYCEQDWKEARRIFLEIYNVYGLGASEVMAERCDILSLNPPGSDWNGVWKMKDK